MTQVSSSLQVREVIFCTGDDDTDAFLKQPECILDNVTHSRCKGGASARALKSMDTGTAPPRDTVDSTTVSPVAVFRDDRHSRSAGILKHTAKVGRHSKHRAHGKGPRLLFSPLRCTAISASPVSKLLLIPT